MPGHLLLLDGFDVDGDLHVVADQDAAGFESGVPGESEVFTVDFGVAEAAMRVKPQGSLVSARRPFHVQHHFPCDAVDRQVSFNLASVLGRRISVLRKVIVGNFAVSKKSGLFRCVSRWASRVLMLSASIVTSTFELAGSTGS